MHRFGLLSVVVLLTAVVTDAPHLWAQDPVGSASTSPARAEASRAELEALLAGSAGRKLSEAERAEVQRRLQEGDIKAGDRIALTVFGEETLSDTFVVRTGRVLALPNMPDVPLEGVLRSELDEYLTAQVGRYIREPDVDATALIRVAIFGAVNNPGYYSLPAEMVTSEALMSAGGPTGNSDVRRTVLRRNGVEIRSEEEMQAALDRGLSLDQMNVQSGDEFVVGSKGSGFMGVLQVAAILSGVALGAAALVRVF